jgi:hypothetical protein
LIIFAPLSTAQIIPFATLATVTVEVSLILTGIKEAFQTTPVTLRLLLPIAPTVPATPVP